MIKSEILTTMIPLEFAKMVSVEHSKVADFHWFNIVSEKNDSLISDRVFTGFDKNIQTAFSKAVSEMVERKSFSRGNADKLLSCSTLRSDGFAAFPIFDNLSLAKEQARENALNEAIERYAWATWWDNTQIQYESSIYSTQDFCKSFPSLKKLLNELNEKIRFERIHIIEPKLLRSEKQLLIVVAEFANGVVTGGACENINNSETILTRALSELLRHALVLIQQKQKPLKLSEYEQRLLYFASPEGKKTFYRRILEKGNQCIELPSLVIDAQIPSDGTHYVHRCLFRNQPPFIDENVERMCL